MTWYFDGDGDGYGNEENIQKSCTQPSNYVGQTGDCDDQDNDIFEGALEICNDEDDDCDDLTDETAIEDPVHPTINLITFYEDADSDSLEILRYPFKVVPFGRLCFNASDCNDSLDDTDGDNVADGFEINPSATEICNNTDSNCDSIIDNNASDALIWYLDFDGDRLETEMFLNNNVANQKLCF